MAVEICERCTTPRDGAKYCRKCLAQKWVMGDPEEPASAAVSARRQTVEYHVVGVMSIASKIGIDAGVAVECKKRAAEGWRLAHAYSDNQKPHRHVLIFERPAAG